MSVNRFGMLILCDAQYALRGWNPALDIASSTGGSCRQCCDPGCPSIPTPLNSLELYGDEEFATSVYCLHEAYARKASIYALVYKRILHVRKMRCGMIRYLVGSL
ncbi:hypothetical protein A0H81_13382 [Grifola frondosa]|uniref:Uncharacterized protein n=1 Tax=Grifola frondosa TaxID=5627 RepID=A0A1C7LRB4_GRIFR|nr:hypothetical protein A0H81_13382 [Grifola frondosa]